MSAGEDGELDKQSVGGKGQYRRSRTRTGRMMSVNGLGQVTGRLLARLPRVSPNAWRKAGQSINRQDPWPRSTATLFRPPFHRITPQSAAQQMQLVKWLNLTDIHPSFPFYNAISPASCL